MKMNFIFFLDLKENGSLTRFSLSVSQIYIKKKNTNTDIVTDKKNMHYF